MNLHSSSKIKFVGNVNGNIPRPPLRRVSLPIDGTIEDKKFEDSDSESDFDFDNNSDDMDDISTKSPTGVTEAVSKALASTQKANRRKVRFYGKVRVHPIRHYRHMSRSERDAIWLTEAEMNLIKTMKKKTVARMISGKAIDEDDPEFCSRGLEAKTPIASEIRNDTKLRARSAVLNEQELQREEAFYDPCFIAMASMEVSFQSRREAHQRGKNDAQSIQLYLQNMPRKKRFRFLSKSDH